MEIISLGIDHKAAAVDVREKFAVPDGRLGEMAARVAGLPGFGEAVVISTCNRVEYYAAGEDVGGGLASLGDQVGNMEIFSKLGAEESVRHLFRVVCGVESMVLGETEILGQVKKAYQAAQAGGATSRCLNKLFQRAFQVAKEVRTHTNITRGAVSVGSVAVELAAKIFGKLDHCNVMILGAGETAEMTARALQSRGVRAIFVSNRTYERAHLLADSLGGRAIRFEEWENEFDELDILIGSTGAPHAVVTQAKLLPLMARRANRPLFCIDLAVPRDFEPLINDLDAVYLYDMDALQGIADASMQVRRQELVRCEEMIERHVRGYLEWLASSHLQRAMKAQREEIK